VPLVTRSIWGVIRLVDRHAVRETSTPEQVAAARERRRKLVASPISRAVVLRGDPRCEATDTEAELADGLRLPLRVYRPHSAGQRPPVILNYHGGGFVSGDPRQSEWWCSRIAVETGAVVVSVDYRLAPEHAYPTAAEDCYAATVWVAEHAEKLGVDAGRLAVMGDSAGGNLAAVVSLLARDRSGPAIALQVLLYPVVDLVDEYPSEVENANAPVLTKADMDSCEAMYFRGVPDERKAEPMASPLRAADHSGLPPALIQTAQHDPLRDQGRVYADALSAAGVAVRLSNYVDAVHGYISIPGIVPASRQALGEVVESLRSALFPVRNGAPVTP
jgi:acetyl esterase